MTTFIGIDLAWGSQAATGLAAINDAGRIEDIATGLTDGEIVEYIQRWMVAPCLVAFDAPLVVNNASGARPCELLVNRYFARYDAACHSSNRARPEFRDGGRAHRLAQQLGLDVDPTSDSPYRAIEVYPHPATVMLFGLDKIVKYKDGTGRTLESLRDELARLMSFIEEHLDPADVTSSPWIDLRGDAARATNKRQLKRAEDRVDAVLCAYIARYSQTMPDSVRTLGDRETGYIVTPVTAEMAKAIDAIAVRSS